MFGRASLKIPSNTLTASRMPWPSGNLSPIRLKVIPSISIGFRLPRSTANSLPLRPSINLKLTLVPSILTAPAFLDKYSVASSKNSISLLPVFTRGRSNGCAI